MRQKILILTVLLFALALSSLSLVAATVQTPPLTVAISKTDNGASVIVWTADIKIAGYSGKDVNLETIVCTWYNNDLTGGQIYPYKISVADSQIKLWFDPTAPGFPATADHSAILGSFNDGNTFSYTSGPGWTWVRHG
jgi:hypothetical protein